MYTKKPKYGKFEGNRSQLLAERVYSTSMLGVDEQAGDTSAGIYICRLSGVRYSYILQENEQGFIFVEVFEKESPLYYETWETLVNTITREEI